ncbi:hypothetical protein MLD38_029117 [Melastoma candidum]|uniref:Uncharacterized protein n=1 Tax=Melastoma candidum TaxID=119954 RepID=A0ACB9N4G2_9MYRT|nr:hypothetical protein MLD38_029117 [Melastoma candidum]
MRTSRAGGWWVVWAEKTAAIWWHIRDASSEGLSEDILPISDEKRSGKLLGRVAGDHWFHSAGCSLANDEMRRGFL